MHFYPGQLYCSVDYIGRYYYTKPHGYPRYRAGTLLLLHHHPARYATVHPKSSRLVLTVVQSVSRFLSTFPPHRTQLSPKGSLRLHCYNILYWHAALHNCYATLHWYTPLVHSTTPLLHYTAALHCYTTPTTPRPLPTMAQSQCPDFCPRPSLDMVV
jgi:hypothetical protein